jgi:hypothetical protein
MLSQNRETCEALRRQLEQERQSSQNLRERPSASIQSIGMERTALAVDQANWVSTEQLKVYQQQADKIDQLHLETIELRLVIQEYHSRMQERVRHVCGQTS